MKPGMFLLKNQKPSLKLSSQKKKLNISQHKDGQFFVLEWYPPQFSFSFLLCWGDPVKEWGGTYRPSDECFWSGSFLGLFGDWVPGKGTEPNWFLIMEGAFPHSIVCRWSLQRPSLENYEWVQVCKYSSLKSIVSLSLTWNGRSQMSRKPNAQISFQIAKGGLSRRKKGKSPSVLGGGQGLWLWLRSLWS